jgi:RNA polymerase sigma-70 factor (ECF subfamily)
MSAQQVPLTGKPRRWRAAVPVDPWTQTDSSIVSRVSNVSQTDYFSLLYQRLHAIAARMMRSERSGHTLQPTALIHEAYVRLRQELPFTSETDFLSVAATLMRRVLVDHARARSTAKRSDRLKVMFQTKLATTHREFDLLVIDDALDLLSQRNECQAKVAELRIFGGLSIAETARVLGRNEPEVKRAWTVARAWLNNKLEVA